MSCCSWRWTPQSSATTAHDTDNQVFVGEDFELAPVTRVPTSDDGRYRRLRGDARPARGSQPCDDSHVILDADAAQARVLAVALMEQVQGLSARLAELERHIELNPNYRNMGARREAVGLHRDIGEAEFLLQRLHRKFPITEATA